MKILITGSNGLLGQKLVEYCIKHVIDFVATSQGENRNPDCPESHYIEMDITNSAGVRTVFTEVKPTHVIHTAALTNVDKCELEPELCDKINIEGTENLINAANEVSAYFQFISTDFIFDGEKGDYRESDLPEPLSEYGRSKLRGEELVKSKCQFGYTIVRTIIVYGMGHALTRSNIIVWAKGALEKGETLNIINDQFRAPTYADDLALGCMQLILKNKQGVYHVSGPETLSIYEIVMRIGKHFGYNTEIINVISSSTLNQPAMRPPKTGFDLTKMRNEVNYQPHTLEETLDLMFK